jgi:hypothetical protein
MGQRKYTYVNFAEEPMVPAFAQTTNAIPTAVDNQVDWMLIDGQYFEWIQTAANADIFFTKSTNVGWIIPNDNTDNDGIEITQGILSAGNGPGEFTVGTDGPFRLKVNFKVPDVSDYDVAFIGFRKVEAYTAALAAHAELGTDYTDIGGLNLNAGAIYSITRLNSGTAVLTDTTQTVADGVAVTFQIDVSAAGVCTFKVNGAAPTVNTNTLTFDTGDLLIPTMCFTKNAGAASDTPPILITYECGIV